MRIIVLIWIFTLLLVGCKSKEQRIIDYIENGYELSDSADYATARVEFANALKLDEYNIDALKGLSVIYEKTEKFPDLYRVVNKILELDPSNEDARRKLVNLFVYVKEFDKAFDELDVLLKHSPQSTDAQVVRASLYFQAGKVAKGLQAAENILASDPNNKHARYMIANHFYSNQQYGKALDMLAIGLKAKPKDLKLNQLKVRVLNVQKKYDSVVEILQMLTAEFPSNIALYKQLANQYLLVDDDINAEKVLKAFAQRAKSVESNLAVVEFFLAKSQVEKAENELKRYIKLFPDQMELQFILTDLLFANGKPEQAKRQLENILNEKNGVERLKAKNYLAHVALKDNDIDTHIQLYKEVVAEDSQNVTALVGLAKVDFGRGEVEKAISSLRALLSHSPNDPQVLLALAKAHEIQGEIDLAQDYYSSALKADSADSIYVSEFSRFLIKKGDSNFAEQVLDRSIKKGIVNKSILSLLAQVKLNLQKWDEAQAVADKLEKMSPEQGIISRIRGYAYRGKAEHTKSIAFFEEAQRSAPQSARPIAALVGAYLRSGETQRAHGFIDSTLKKNPQHLQAQLLKGLVYEFEKDFSKAEAVYRKALKLNPEYMASYRNLTRVLVVQGKIDSALTAVQTGRAQLPNNVNLAISEAVLLERLNKFQQAISVYRKLLEKDSSSDIAANNLAILLLKQGGEPALEESKRLAERFRNSEVPQFQDTLGWVYLNTGNNVDALYLLEKASRALDDVAEVRYHLGMAYLKNDRKPEAKRELSFAVKKLDQDFPEKNIAVAQLATLAD
ncbi:MAG: tetratricopeptide repeat protein [Cellvibrionaceae bacterium]|nr:tetratricopeptide repeat protein [Cellvibrionaceae bacterium]